MNEPNYPQEQATSQGSPKMSSRATNFLMMGANANKGATSTGSLESDPTTVASPSPPEEHPETPPESEKKTGVISSTIYPAQRPGNTPSQPESPAAASTGRLDKPHSQKSKSAPLSAEDKQRLTDERIDKLADRITNVLEKISLLKTGILNPDVETSEKIQLMSEKSPAFSKFLAILLTQLEPVLLLVQRINQKMVEKNLVQAKPSKKPQEEEVDKPPPPPEPVSFLELAEKNIIFCDNRKRPLYTLEQMRGKHGYTVSEEVIAPMILDEIIKAFHEVAPKAKAIPTPTSGLYANIPMDQVMENISEEEVMRFLSYVQRFPRGYVGKSFRITESFAGWVVSGTPDD